MISEEKIRYLEEKARQLRLSVVEMIGVGPVGHLGGSCSCADIVAALYYYRMSFDPKNPDKVDRDRFLLSKGHAAPVLYAALAEKGFFPKEELLKLRKTGHFLQGHPDMNKVPGVDMSTGSLGHGISVAAGMALAAKIDNKDYRVYCLLGDGEAEEGIVWEAAMAAAHYKLDNLLVILDHNGLQIDGPVKDVMNLEPLPDKWRAFGWNVLEVDGHNIEELTASLQVAKNFVGKPTIIIAKTVKGKGVSFMENQVGWHGNAPSAEQAEAALAELKGGNSNG